MINGGGREGGRRQGKRCRKTGTETTTTELHCQVTQLVHKECIMVPSTLTHILFHANHKTKLFYYNRTKQYTGKKKIEEGEGGIGSRHKTWQKKKKKKKGSRHKTWQKKKKKKKH